MTLGSKIYGNKENQNETCFNINITFKKIDFDNNQDQIKGLELIFDPLISIIIIALLFYFLF